MGQTALFSVWSSYWSCDFHFHCKKKKKKRLVLEFIVNSGWLEPQFYFTTTAEAHWECLLNAWKTDFGWGITLTTIKLISLQQPRLCGNTGWIQCPEWPIFIGSSTFDRLATYSEKLSKLWQKLSKCVQKKYTLAILTPMIWPHKFRLINLKLMMKTGHRRWHLKSTGESFWVTHS